MKPGGKPAGQFPHLGLQAIDFDPTPSGDLGGVGSRVAFAYAKQDQIVLVLHASALRIDRTIDKRRPERQFAIDSHLLAEPATSRLNRRFPFARMAATGVRPDQRPEHFLPAALLNQQLSPIGAEEIDRKGQVQQPVAGVGFEDIGKPGWAAGLIAEDDLAFRVHIYPIIRAALKFGRAGGSTGN